MKFAVTIDRVVGVTVQVVIPVHAPPQPAKVEPVSGVAVRVTIVPVENTPVQSVGLRLVLVLLQLPIAELGLPETVPAPVTWTWTSGGSFHAVGGVWSQFPVVL